MTCHDCDRPMATDANLRSDDEPRPEDAALCWRAFHGDQCQQPIDWRARCRALDTENTALVDQLFTQAAGRDDEARRATIAELHIARMRPANAVADALVDRLREQVVARDAALDACQERIAGLLTRRDELLALVAKLSQTTPLASELESWEGQRATMLAEIGTLRAERASFERHNRELWAERQAAQNAAQEVAVALMTARTEVAALRATVLGLLAVAPPAAAACDEHALDCSACGLAFNAAHLHDGADVACAGCGATNTVAIDDDGSVYVCVWACAHGIGHEDKCERCAETELAVRESAEVITE